MRVYLLCLAKSPGGLPGLPAVQTAAADSLPFRTTTVDGSWESPDGRVAAWAWHNEGAEVAPLCRLGDGVVGHTGYTIGGSPYDAPDACAGVWASLRAAPSEIMATTCASGTEQVFYAETAERVVIGTRALLVGLVAHGGVELDTAGLAAIVNAGFSTTERTVLRGVRAVPADSRVVARADAALRVEPAPRERGSVPDASAVAAALVTSVSGFPVTTGTIRLGLTGGRDSRLLAAVLVSAGVPLRAVTSGADDDPDVVIARRVAQTLGIEHRVNPPQTVKVRASELEVDPRRRVREAVALGEGMLGAYDKVGRVDQRFDPTLIPLSGSGGEILRGLYADALGGVESPDAARRVLRRRVLPQEKLLTPGALEEYLADLDGWTRAAAEEPAEALVDFYVRQRTARWSGAARSATAMGSLAWRPFYDHLVVRSALAVPLDQRVSERLFAAVLDDLAPGLGDVPLVGKRWAFDQQRPSDPHERERWEERAPLVGARGGGRRFDWRTDLPEVRSELRSIVEAAPDRFWQVVDEQAVGRLCQRLESATRAQTLVLWNLATVAHAVATDLERGQAKFAIGPTPVTAPPPAPGPEEPPLRDRLGAAARKRAKQAYLRFSAVRSRARR